MGRSRPEIGLYYRDLRRQSAPRTPRPRASTYEDRDKLLILLGYTTYAAYLQSDLWSRLRGSAFKVHGKQCRLCDVQANVIHHIDYDRETLEGTQLSSLTPLCHGCHEKVEFDGGKKRKLASARNVYKNLLAGVDKKRGVPSEWSARKAKRKAIRKAEQKALLESTHCEQHAS